MKSHRNRSRTKRALAGIGIGALLITAGGLALAKGPTAVPMDVIDGRVAPAVSEAPGVKAKARAEREKPGKLDSKAIVARKRAAKAAALRKAGKTKVAPKRATPPSARALAARELAAEKKAAMVAKKGDKAAYKATRKASKGFRGKGAFDPEKRVERIKELLGLDDATAKRLGAVFGEHHASMKDMHENGGRIRTALAKEMEADVPNEKRVASLLDAMEMNRKAMDAERSVLGDSMKKLLTPSQRAKLFLSRGSHGRGGHGGPGGPGGPGSKGPRK